MTHEFASLLKDINILPVSCKLLGLLFGVNCEFLERQYCNYLIGYMNWNQLFHAEEWILFEKNIGPYVSLMKSRRTLYNSDKQGEKRMFGKHHRNHKRYGCQDCHIRPVKAFQTQTLPGQGNNP